MQPGTADDPGWLKVVDPLAGTYYVPWAQIHQTSGTTSVFTKPRDISLCLLYQKGSCNASTRCHQVHADTTFVESMRALHKHNNTCCPHHGDCLSNLDGLLDTMLNSEAGVFLYGKRAANKGIEIPKLRIGRTIFLERLLNSNPPNKPLHIPVDKVCGLHQQHKCLYSHGCRNLHICRELWSQLLVQHGWLSKETREAKHNAKNGKREEGIRYEGAAQVDEIYTLDASAVPGRPPIILPSQNGHGPMPYVHTMMAPPHNPMAPPLNQIAHMVADVMPRNGLENSRGPPMMYQHPPQMQQTMPLMNSPMPRMNGHQGRLSHEEDPLEITGDSLGSIVESYGHDEASDLVSDILDMPPSLIENLHQLIMEDNKGKGRTLNSMKPPAEHHPSLKTGPGSNPSGPKSHPANFGPYGPIPPMVPPAPVPVSPIAHAPPPPASGAPSKSKFLHISQPQGPPQMPQLGSTLQHMQGNGQAPVVLLVPPNPAEIMVPSNMVPSASYLVAMPIDGASNVVNTNFTNAIPVDPQSAQRLMQGNPNISVVSIPAPQPGPPPAQPFTLVQAAVPMAPQVAMVSPAPPPQPMVAPPVGMEPAKPPPTKSDSAPGGVMKAMSHLTRAGFFGELQELIQWKEAGMLTETEFAAVKARMLAEHNVTTA